MCEILTRCLKQLKTEINLFCVIKKLLINHITNQNMKNRSKNMIKYHLIKRCPLYLKAILRVCLKKTVMNESDLIYKLMNVKGRKSKTMIDVGAHYGDSLSSFLLSGWQIHAFEPDLNNREYLLKQFGKYPNIIIDPRAVSNKEESNVMFYNSDVSTGISTLHPFHPSHKEMSNSVNVITLRSYINKVKNNNIDFLKIDVEGFDLFVLQGFPWVEINPTIILAEFEQLWRI